MLSRIKCINQIFQSSSILLSNRPTLDSPRSRGAGRNSQNSIRYLSVGANRALMDYIRRTVTFELRSIIRNSAIKPPRGRREGSRVYTYTYTRDGTTWRTAPSSDFNKNVKFYFQIRRHCRRAHRSCSLSLPELVSLLSSSFRQHHCPHPRSFPTGFSPLRVFTR